MAVKDIRLSGAAETLYEQIKDIGIVSPHGHCEAQWFAENSPFPNPAQLLIQPDHYVFRMFLERLVGSAASIANRVSTLKATGKGKFCIATRSRPCRYRVWVSIRSWCHLRISLEDCQFDARGKLLIHPMVAIGFFVWHSKIN